MSDPEFSPRADACPHCPLCQQAGGELVWASSLARVVQVDDAAHPGYTRVILNRHVAEMSDLEGAERMELMGLVFRVEQVLREIMQPEKVNLAALGNMVPHLHWHIIPRWRDDPTFPDAIWAAPRREPAPVAARTAALARYRTALVTALDAVSAQPLS